MLLLDIHVAFHNSLHAQVTALAFGQVLALLVPSLRGRCSSLRCAPAAKTFLNFVYFDIFLQIPDAIDMCSVERLFSSEPGFVGFRTGSLTGQLAFTPDTSLYRS